MPDLVISDSGPGVVDVHTQTIHVRVLASELYMDVILGTDVTIKGTPLDDETFMRLRLEWNGGTVTPTILAVYPTHFEDDTQFEIFYQGNYVGEFVITWSPTSAGDGSVYVGNIVGTSFNEIISTGYLQGSTRDSRGIAMRLNGTNVEPADGDQCTITILA